MEQYELVALAVTPIAALQREAEQVQRQEQAFKEAHTAVGSPSPGTLIALDLVAWRWATTPATAGTGGPDNASVVPARKED